MKIKTTIKFIISIISIFFISKTSLTQWTTDPSVNTPVCVATGKQVDTRISPDGLGGSFIAWKDYRSGSSDPDIYIQYLNASGVAQWTLDGVYLCYNSSDQSTPAITTDMNGGAIVAWSDWRSGVERDVYAQRIDASGIVQWTIDGVAVANKPVREHNEKIISDDHGGAIIVWEQQDSFGQWDIWAQRINNNGITLWPDGGIPICTVNANRLNPKVQRDGKGGAIITWQDYRSFVDYDIYAQRLSPTGTLKWGGTAHMICGATGAQLDPKIDPDSLKGGVFISWIDKRTALDYDIYAQRIDSNGADIWANNGVPVCTAVGNQTAQDILSSTITNGLIVTWKDKRNGQYDIYSQKLNLLGSPLWVTNGVTVCNSIRDQINPNIVEDLNGGAIITWQDSTLNDWDIKAQHVKSDGSMGWLVNGENVSIATGPQTSPKSVSDGNGGCIFAFQDKRSGTSDIYAHHLFSNGSPISNLGIDELIVTNTLTSFPNPFSDKFQLYLNTLKGEKQIITVEDILGNQVPMNISEPTINSNGKSEITISADRSLVSCGMYFVKISGDKGIQTMQIIFE